MEEKTKKQVDEEYYCDENLRLQKATIAMQGFFTLGFLYFTYIVFLKPHIDFLSNFISIFFMMMILICILYVLLPIKVSIKH